VQATRPYATKAWEVLLHLASQPARDVAHPLLTQRTEVRRVTVVVITSDRGLAGAYNSNLIRYCLESFRSSAAPVTYVFVGRKGRDMMTRRRIDVRADFSGLPADPSFGDVSAIGRLVVEDYLEGRADQVFLVYTRFVNLLRQVPTTKLLLPLELDRPEARVTEFQPTSGPAPAYIYEPGEEELIGQIVPRFTALQVFHAVMESLASEHAARMVAMQNATQNAGELGSALRLEYNQARQQAITSEMLDIVGGVEAQRE
jgi:F-type H+-transporting ATPase subunit gamma